MFVFRKFKLATGNSDELILSDKLKKAFIRKMDDLCQMERIYYFAYGSNLNYDIINKRTGFGSVMIFV